MLTLEGAVREVVGAVALGAAGLRTSRILAVVQSEGAPSVMRGVPAVAAPGGVLVRCVSSFVRFGSFERLLHLDLTRREQAEQVANLARYCLTCCYPELQPTAAGAALADKAAGVKAAGTGALAEAAAVIAEVEATVEVEAEAAAFRALFRAVCNRTAAMCAGMMATGFTHGVLNTVRRARHPLHASTTTHAAARVVDRTICSSLVKCWTTVRSSISTDRAMSRLALM